MDGQVVIISAPSGSGKSMWLAGLITKELMRGQCVHVCSAAKTYETFLSYIKEHYNSDGSCFSSPLSLSALFGSADIFALEDVDIFLSGRENTQNTFAQIIVEAAHEALDRITEARYTPTKGRAEECWKYILGPSFN